jgi:hypothetical protein
LREAKGRENIVHKELSSLLGCDGVAARYVNGIFGEAVNHHHDVVEPSRFREGADKVHRH